jgi:hypothetical protein
VIEGMNSSIIYLIYCENLCKYHNAPPPSTAIKEKNKNFGTKIHVSTTHLGAKKENGLIELFFSLWLKGISKIETKCKK